MNSLPNSISSNIQTSSTLFSSQETTSKNNKILEEKEFLEDSKTVQGNIFESKIEKKEFFDDEKNVATAKITANYLIKSKWDLKPYYSLKLIQFLHFKFLETIRLHTVKKPLTEEQESQVGILFGALSEELSDLHDEVYEHLSIENKLKDKSSAFVDSMKESSEFQSILFLGLILKSSQPLFMLTIEEILSQKHCKGSEKKVACDDDTIIRSYYYGFSLASSLYKEILTRLESMKDNDSQFVQQHRPQNNSRKAPENIQKVRRLVSQYAVFQKLVKQLSFLYTHQHKDLVTQWKSFLKTPKTLLLQRKFQLEVLREKIPRFKEYFSETCDMLCSYLEYSKKHYEAIIGSKNDRKFDFDMEAFLKSASKADSRLDLTPQERENRMQNLKLQLSQIKNEKNHEKLERDKMYAAFEVGLKKQPKGLVEEIKISSSKEAKKLGITLSFMDRYVTILKSFDIASKSIMLEVTQALDQDIKEGVSLEYVQWSEEEFVKPKKIKKKKENPCSIQEDETCKVEEVEKLTTPSPINNEHSTEPILNDLKNLCKEFDKKSLLDVDMNSLETIQKFTILVNSALTSKLKGPKASALELKVDQEWETHLTNLGRGWDLSLHQIAQDDLEGLGCTMMTMCMDLHVLLEQLMQKEYIGIKGEPFLVNHRLSDLFSETKTWKQLKGPLKELTHKLGTSLLWQRYVKYFQNRYPKENDRPEGLKQIIVGMGLVESAQKGLKVEKGDVTGLIDFISTSLKMTFECLFEVSGDQVSEDLKSQWLSFLQKSQTLATTHLVNMENQTKDSDYLNEQCKILQKRIQSTEEILTRYSETASLPGNPLLAMDEALQQMKRLLTTIKMTGKYSHPRFNGLHMRNIMGSCQWGLEQLIKSLSLSQGLSPVSTHSFDLLLGMLLNHMQVQNPNLSPEKITEFEEKKQKALRLNCSVGAHYIHIVNVKNELFSIYKEMQMTSEQYILSSENQRNQFDEDNLKNAIQGAIEVFEEFVPWSLKELNNANQKLISKRSK